MKKLGQTFKNIQKCKHLKILNDYLTIYITMKSN